MVSCINIILPLWKRRWRLRKVKRHTNITEQIENWKPNSGFVNYSNCSFTYSMLIMYSTYLKLSLLALPSQMWSSRVSLFGEWYLHVSNSGARTLNTLSSFGFQDTTLSQFCFYLACHSFVLFLLVPLLDFLFLRVTQNLFFSLHSLPCWTHLLRFSICP